MEKIILNVEGMSCNHCVNAVKEALGELKVQEVDVSLQDKTVTVVYDNTQISAEKLKETIEDQGFEVK